MSSAAPPITPARFAAALPDLPLSSLHAKAAELRNSIAHLEASNDQLQPFAGEGDRDCAEAIRENREVMGRMKERIELLRVEVVRRGYLWTEDGGVVNGEEKDDEDVEMIHRIGEVNGDNSARVGSQARVVAAGGRLNDEELARRLRERMEEDAGDNDGVHL